MVEQESSTNSSGLLFNRFGASSKTNIQEESDVRTDASDANTKGDIFEASSLLFAPPELKNIMLRSLNHIFDGNSPDKSNTESSHVEVNNEGKHLIEKHLCNQFQNGLILDIDFSVEHFNLQADYLQLVNHQDCELRASEFQRLALELHSQNDITPEGHDAAVDALLLAAECYVNPFFMMAFQATPKLINKVNTRDAKIPQEYDITELKRVCKIKNNDLETIAHLERKRDKTVLQLLLQAAELDREYERRASMGEPVQYVTRENGKGIEISPLDVHSADAVTLVRQNQALLCHFLVQRLQREHSMHEILMQSLLFLLHSATELFCPPENVIDIILGSAEYLNGLLTSFYNQLKEGKLQLDPEKVHGVQRCWVLLQRLVIASSGSDDGTDLRINSQNGLRYQTLVPPSSWMQRIPKFSSSPYPLVRFLGWMAISRYAKQYLKERLFLASDLSQLACLLSIFADDLAFVDNIVNQKDEPLRLEHSGSKHDLQADKGPDHGDLSFHVIYPHLNKFFPTMKRQFGAFGEIILEAVGLQLRSLPSTAIPDVLCWFSDICLWPFIEIEKDHLSAGNTTDHLKGYAAKNAKVVILYTLEAIVAEHMESMLPEIPRVVQILVSLCRSSYCDVAFLDSVLRLLKPLISHALGKIPDVEKQLTDESCLNFESLCFDELFSNIRSRNEYQNGPPAKVIRGALTIFVLGSLFPDLSFPRRREILQSLLLWADFATFEPTSSLYDYICAFQNVMESCEFLLVQSLRKNGVLIPEQKPHLSEEKSVVKHNDISSSSSYFQNDVQANNNASPSDGKVYDLSTDEIKLFKGLKDLISKLNPTIELCWKLHHQLAMKLTLATSKCFMYSRCLSSIGLLVSINGNDDNGDAVPSIVSEIFSSHWISALEGLVGSVMKLQKSHCWQVASVVLDYVLGLPPYFCLDHVLCTICSAIKNFSCHAPRIEWRLQTDKWLSTLFMRGIGDLHGDGASLVDLFCTMLSHSEPEQRSVALKHLGRLVGQDANGAVKFSYTVCGKSISSESVLIIPESIQSLLVSSTWDRVASLASSDSSLLLRTHAMSLLLHYIPFAQRIQLQSFLGAADSILCGLGTLAYPVREGPLAQLSLALLAGACLHSPCEDIALIPQSVWRNLETLGMPNAGMRTYPPKSIDSLLRKINL